MINNYDIDDIELNSFRKLIGYVPQDVFLFSDTITNNIAFGLDDGDFTDQEVKDAAISAGIYDEITKFKDELNTKIGERGVTLSGGQKQRIAIARALIRKPQLLILDDSLSAIDTETSSKIQSMLTKNNPNQMTIHISHRVSQVSHCNHILVIDNGAIIQSGNHKELISKKSFIKLFSINNNWKKLIRINFLNHALNKKGYLYCTKI